jgi:hypothetical protein
MVGEPRPHPFSSQPGMVADKLVAQQPHAPDWRYVPSGRACCGSQLSCNSAWFRWTPRQRVMRNVMRQDHELVQGGDYDYE